MSGRRDDHVPGHEQDAAAVDPLAGVLHDDPGLAGALEALPAALEPAALPDGAWDRLAASLAGPMASSRERGTVTAAEDRPGEARGRSARGRAWRFDSAHPLSWLAAAVIAGAVVGLGTWGTLQAGARARVVEEQRVLAYWMANPDLRMVALNAVTGAGPAVEDTPGRLGVVCILPDGRALLLQPAPAERGSSYVVVSRGDDGDTDLGGGRSNVIRFDLAGAERVVVMRESRGGERVPVAWADVN